MRGDGGRVGKSESASAARVPLFVVAANVGLAVAPDQRGLPGVRRAGKQVEGNGPDAGGEGVRRPSVEPSFDGGGREGEGPSAVAVSDDDDRFAPRGSDGRGEGGGEEGSVGGEVLHLAAVLKAGEVES